MTYFDKCKNRIEAADTVCRTCDYGGTIYSIGYLEIRSTGRLDKAYEASFKGVDITQCIGDAEKLFKLASIKYYETLQSGVKRDLERVLSEL